MPAPSLTSGAMKLMALGKNLVTHAGWGPHDGKTYCNFAVAAAANYFGYKKFYDEKSQPLMANDIINIMCKDPSWKLVDDSAAYEAALAGKLVIAYHQESPHGHVALVAPLPRPWSNKWSTYCPQVFNVGKTMNFEAPFAIGENQAFVYRPSHRLYAPVS